MRLQHCDLAIARVRRLTRQAVVQDAAERVDVGAAVERLAPDLLGAAVVDCPEEGAGLCHRLGARALGEAEVAEVGVPVGEQDVRRLEVAMDQVGAVGVVEGTADLLGDPERIGPGEGSALPDLRLQARTVHVAHCEVQDTVDLVCVVDRDHVRVVERSGELRLAEEARAKVRVAGQGGRDHLECDPPLESRVRREVDGPHAAPAEDGLDLVRAELVAGVHGHV